jgi:hypothetical protein
MICIKHMCRLPRMGEYVEPHKIQYWYDNKQWHEKNVLHM